MAQNVVATGFEFKYDVVDLTDNSTDVTDSAAIIRGIYVNTVNSADCLIKDGTTTVFTIPANTPAGSTIPLFDTRFESKIVVDPGDSDTGSFTVTYKERV